MALTDLTSLLKKLGSAVLDALFPLFCKICGKPMKTKDFVCICEACWNSIRFLPERVCVFCGMPLLPEISHLFIPFKSSSSSGKNIICLSCRKKKPVFSSARAIGFYEGVLREAIHIFKFQPKPTLARPLVNLLFLHYQKGKWFDNNMTLIPMPVHSTKERERGFNQAELLAEEISQVWTQKFEPLQIEKNALVKIKTTSPQSELKAEERWKNVKGSFKVTDPNLVDGRSIVLIDDVLTTGATASEASLMLFKAGAKDVRVVTLARGILRHSKNDKYVT